MELTETEVGVYLAESIRYGGYFLYEETAPEGFLKDDTYHYFEIRNDGETITVENKAGVGFTNKPIVGKLELTKTDIADGKPLAGVGFRIKDADGNTVIEGYTDENGIAKFTLRYGKYTAIKASIINRKDGVVDQQTFKFSDIIGMKPHRIRGQEAPYMWEYNNKPVWYTPVTIEEKARIADTVLDYVEMYQEPTMSANEMQFQ